MEKIFAAKRAWKRQEGVEGQEWTSPGGVPSGFAPLRRVGGLRDPDRRPSSWEKGRVHPVWADGPDFRNEGWGRGARVYQDWGLRPTDGHVVVANTAV